MSYKAARCKRARPRGGGTLHGVGKIIEHLNHHWVYGLVVESAEKSDTQASNSKLIPTKYGVYNEPPSKTPKKHVWVEKPNHLKNKLDTLPYIAYEHPKPQRMLGPTVWIPSGTTKELSPFLTHRLRSLNLK